MLQRIWRAVEPDPETGCWIWTGHKNLGGYGRIHVGPGTKKAPAHRVVYEAFNGPVPDGLEMDHICEVRACVNPSHLKAATHLENMQRRTKFPCGYKQLTPDQVRDIKSANETTLETAKRLGYNYTTIQNVRRGALYADIN